MTKILSPFFLLFIFSFLSIALPLESSQKPLVRVQFRHWFEPTENFIDVALPKDDYTFEVVDQDPDLIFFSILPEKQSFIEKLLHRIKRNYRKIILDQGRFAIPPVAPSKAPRVFVSIENTRPDMEACEYAFTSDLDEDIKSPKHRHWPLYTYLMKGDAIRLQTKKKFDKSILEQKTRFCNFIYSNKRPGLRNRFFDKLSLYKQVDAPGKSKNNYPNAEFEEIGKETFQSQCKFTIAFENSRARGYTTEKIAYAMLADTIPIYWGDPEVDRNFNSHSFLNYDDCEKEAYASFPEFLFKIPLINKVCLWLVEELAMDKLVERIIELDTNDDLYLEMLNQPWVTNEEMVEKLDLEHMRNTFKEVIDTEL